MSGGSYNYLYTKRTFSELFDSIPDLESFEKSLIDYGYSNIALDVRSLIDFLVSSDSFVESRSSDLADVFRAVEFFDSSDIDRGSMISVLDSYCSRKIAEYNQ